MGDHEGRPYGNCGTCSGTPCGCHSFFCQNGTHKGCRYKRVRLVLLEQGGGFKQGFPYADDERDAYV
ncbi:hypothetical protein EDC26_10198 [Paralcaligenes ureilyticus]|uniref:Uncharacterized protein n=1 Tax=Paralcaligenes ureilyticus TaxID=627131 RepID=A0A4V6NZQ2_9BURK|nr:hypothetical protein EDC26_10198 [Paralcaligenes ureilyticus]